MRGRSILADLLRPIAQHDAEWFATLLLDEFGSLPAVLATDPAVLARVLDGRDAVADHLAAVRAGLLHCLAFKAAGRPLMGTYTVVTDYLRALLGHCPREQVGVLYLDAGNKLIRAETTDAGTVDQAPFYPREILRRGLELGAAALIVAHNHPGGDLTPSDDDVAATKRLIAAAGTMGMTVHDHLIVAGNGWSSMRAEGLL